ncbi:hypothetical protein AAIB41_17725 [Brucella sp. BE17]|uniref:hypothetical protein n=1 Tax=Brucella sp. BE17 TaxID=3142977 RepID=UPI0031BAC3AF
MTELLNKIITRTDPAARNGYPARLGQSRHLRLEEQGLSANMINDAQERFIEAI